MADSIFTELKRRNVFKVGVAYLVLAWVVIQVTDSAVPAFGMPEWVNTVIFFFGIVGFPFAIFFAWAFEVTPDGIKKESEIAPEHSITSHTSRKLDFTIIGLLVLVAGYFIYESRFQTQPEIVVTKKSSAEVDTPKKVSQEVEGSSIAVLPFVDMSPNRDHDYFSDGISEEILNVLAKIPNLKVTSRSSAFAFKGSKINISDVAKKLGVNNVLEGSVRKAGNRIRITAQLIEAGTDTHLWSETYDRELTDIFAVQDEISAAIVEALKSKLGLEVNVAKRDMSKVNLDAHNEYLKGRFYMENRNQDDLEKALAHFEKAIVLAPDYAPAWMGKASTSLFLSEVQYGEIPHVIALERSRTAIEKALQYDPFLPESYGILGLIEKTSFEIEKANTNYQKAIELNPNYADVYSWYSFNLDDQPNKQFELSTKAIQLNPMSMMVNLTYASNLLVYGKIDEAREVAEHMFSINDSHVFPYTLLGDINKIQGNYAQAAIFFTTAATNSSGRLESKYQLSDTLADMGLEEKAADYLKGIAHGIWSHLYRGNKELFLSQAREIYPRNEDDYLGAAYRAIAEMNDANYSEAIKFYTLSDINRFTDELIYAYKQVGNAEAAEALMDKTRATLTSRLDNNVQYWNVEPIEIRIMEVAYLDDDIELAIVNLKKAMDKGYIISFVYKTAPMFKKLRDHSEWPTLLAKSDKRASKQREIYLKLIAEKEATTL